MIELTIYSKSNQDLLFFQYDSVDELQDILSLANKTIDSFQVKNGVVIGTLQDEVVK